LKINLCLDLMVVNGPDMRLCSPVYPAWPDGRAIHRSPWLASCSRALPLQAGPLAPGPACPRPCARTWGPGAPGWAGALGPGLDCWSNRPSISSWQVVSSQYFSSSSMPRNCSSAVSRLSTISRARIVGWGTSYLSNSSVLSLVRIQSCAIYPHA